jgi:hypothetical protein
MISLDDGADLKFFTLGELAVIAMRSEKSAEQASVSILKGNSFIIFNQTMTVYRNRQFVNISITIDSVTDGVSLLSLDSILHIKGQLINKTDTVGLFEEGSKVLGQLIYAENCPEEVRLITGENPSGLEFVYNLHGDSSVKIQLFASAFSVSNSEELYENKVASENPYLNDLLDENVKTFLDPDQNETENLSLVLFDYKKAVTDYSISYINCRDFSVLKKFTNDPTFCRVFINDEVAVFKVGKIPNLEGATP